MICQAVGAVTRLVAATGDAQELEVRLPHGDNSARRAIAYPSLVGGVSVGDRVLLNITAQTLNLGTGGYDFVMANLSAADALPGAAANEIHAAVSDVHAPVNVVFAALNDIFVAASDIFPDENGVFPAVNYVFTAPNDVYAALSKVYANLNAVHDALSAVDATLNDVFDAPNGAGGDNQVANATPHGHIIKGRYLPCQTAVLTLEEQEQYADVWERTLDGFPVLVGGLHSQVAPAAAALHLAGKKRVAYIMTDGAALPLAFSRLVGELKRAGLLAVTFTCGQAFGGDHETVTLHSALLAARHMDKDAPCDAAIVCQGPGNAGTGTRYGFSGIEQAAALDTVRALGGRPVAIVRMSAADARERHQGISHHTRTVLDLAYARCLVPVPVGTDASTLPPGHDVREVGNTHAALDLLLAKNIAVTTMGRAPAADLLFFHAAAAAGLALAPESTPMTQQNAEKTTSARRIYDGKVINLRVDTVVLPGGGMSEREVVEHRGAVALVPLTDAGTVLLVRQWRAPAAAALLEIPAGTLDEGEEALACAHRELGEEVNQRANRMTALFSMYVAPGYSTEVIHVYAAQELSPMQGQLDADEFLDIVEMPLADAIHKITTGEIIDAKSISGLLMADRLIKSGAL